MKKCKATQLGLEGTQDEHHQNSNPDGLHRVLMKAVSVGQSLRRGAYGLPCNITESLRWLTFFIARGRKKSAARSAAELELGLIERQLSISRERMSCGVDLVRNACESDDGGVRCNAQFWLGLWYHKGLSFPSTDRPGDDQAVPPIVPKNNVIAANYFFKSATGTVPNKEAMAFCSKFARDGLGDVEVNPQSATTWNRRAREAGSVSAMVQYGNALKDDARLVYAARPSTWGATGNRTARSSRTGSQIES